MKLRILFVDDEPNVLQGIRRMLHPLRREWEMKFAEDGAKALEQMAESPFDLIVSDMRMPGMDGAQLLDEVRRRHPHVARLILSGHSDKEMIMRSVGPAHQFLAKPCTPEFLKIAIDRAVSMRRLMADDALRGVVANIQALPSLPSVYMEIVDALRNEMCAAEHLGEIVSRDIGMMTKILQLVNSAFFGLPRRISSPAQAVSYLGIETIRALVLSVGIFSQFPDRKVAGFSLHRLWDHSMTVGLYAKAIARETMKDAKLADAALLAGVLHDLGKLVLATERPDQYAVVLSRAEETGLDEWKLEREIFGTDHAALGAYLLGLWGIDDLVVEAVAFHHTPDEAAAAHTEFTLPSTVSVANVLAIASMITFSDLFDHACHEKRSQGDCEVVQRKVPVSELGPNAEKWIEICMKVTSNRVGSD
jgi:putative nucleotidyltransferase with HDIG domain